MENVNYGPWRKTIGDGPDWKDIGKTAQAKFDDGVIVSGQLVSEDFFATDEGDEVPLIYVEQSDGTQRLAYEAEYWREALPR